MFSMKLLSVVRGLAVFGGLSKALALVIEYPFSGRVDVVSVEEVSCATAMVTTSIQLSNIVMIK
jgi:hypothetical protein